MKASRGFQDKLKLIVIHKLLTLVGTGSVLFAVGMILAVTVTNYKNAKDNATVYSNKFENVYNEGAKFLRDETLQDLCKQILNYEKDTSQLPYMIYEFNASFPMQVKIVLSDKERNIVYKSYSDMEWDFYRNSFNKAICANAFLVGLDEIYSSVYYFNGNASNYVMSKPIYEYGITIGYLNLYIEDQWEECLYNAEYEGIITDYRGRVIHSSRQSFITGINKFEPESNQSIININGRRYWQYRQELEEAGVIIYSLIYYPRNNSLLFAAVGLIFLMTVWWFVLANVMAESMAQSNSAAVSKLVKEIKAIGEENSSYRITMATEDEFAEIGLSINQMLDSINELNLKNTELLRINNITEINQLTAQVNPHFLYNTLEIIRNLLIFDSKKADSLIVKLTQILRYSINNSRKYVCLEEDMLYIKDYLEIQKSRFEDNLHFAIAIDEPCLQCIVPKLLLQPLIENSIKYGFRKKMKIQVGIQGKMEGNILYLSVTDDGVGMTKEEAESLQQSIYEAVTESEHNGLHNIARRLYLLYGLDSGLDIIPMETEGLKVVIRINLERGMSCTK